MPDKVLPQVSIILPVYNGGRFLAACVSSVLNQSLAAHELLIADDASSDSSWSIIESFSDERLHAIRNGRHLGLFKSLNALVHGARAPLIHILCQDDLLEPDCLERELKFFAEHPDIAMSYCKATFIDESNAETGQTPINDLPEINDPLASMQYFYYLGCLPGNLSTVCVQKSAFERFGLFDETFQVAGDYEMWVRICQQANLGIIHRFLIRLRRHNGQLSRAHLSVVAAIGEVRRIRSLILPYLPPVIQAPARWYVRLGQNVHDTSYALRCLASGHFKDFIDIARTLGFGDLVWGLFFGFLSLNNHLWKPRARYYLGA